MVASRRFETVGAATLYLSDCREVIFEPAALVVSDPPYRLTSGGDTPGGMQGGWLDDYSNNGAPVTCDIDWPEILGVVARAMAKDADAYLFANDKNVRALLNAAHEAGLGFHNLLAWDKVSATANRWYMKNLEFVAYLWKGHARRINDASCKQLIRARQVDASAHPTEKPVAVCQLYIENSTSPGDLVVDPFMGSGTTGVAAIRAGRRFVGVEIEPQWFEVALDRIRAATTQGELFGAPAS